MAALAFAVLVLCGCGGKGECDVHDTGTAGDAASPPSGGGSMPDNGQGFEDGGQGYGDDRQSPWDGESSGGGGTDNTHGEDIIRDWEWG